MSKNKPILFHAKKPHFEIQVLNMLAIKCHSDFRIFQKISECLSQQKPLYIMLAMASAYLRILPRAMI